VPVEHIIGQRRPTPHPCIGADAARVGLALPAAELADLVVDDADDLILDRLGDVVGGVLLSPADCSAGVASRGDQLDPLHALVE